MKIRQFEQLSKGSHVSDGERDGEVIKISQEKDKALIRFRDGSIEWIEYYRIEIK